MWRQVEFNLSPKSRGFHLVTSEVLKHLELVREYRVGLLHLFIQHTSASLTINENADPDVRSDMEKHFMKFVPENAPYYDHVLEGADDMPAHIKSSILGSELSIPISNGRLGLGIWQGIYLGEHRNHGGSRSLIATLQGECY